MSVASPTAALALAAAGLAVFGTWFALHETADVTHAATSRTTGAAGPLLTPALVVLGVAQLLVGSVFGSVQTGTSVLATAPRHPA